MAITDGLCVHLEGPTGLVDQSGNGKNGTYSGGMGTVASDGRLAFSSDGTDDYLSIPPEVVPENFPFSVAFWVRSAGESRISFTQTSTFNRYYWWGTSPTNAIAASRFASVTATQQTTNTTLADTWSHVTVTYLSGASRRIVLNGNIAGAVTNTTDLLMVEPTFTDPQMFTVGASIRSSATVYFEQLTDSIRVYNRVLSEAEIQFLASARGAGSGNMLLGRRVIDSVIHNPIQPVIF